MAARRIHKPHRRAQESKRIDGRADDSKQEEIHLKVPHPKIRRDARQLRVPGASSRHTSGRRESLDRAAQFDAAQHIHQTAGTKGGAEDHPMFSSEKRAHAIHPPVPQILSQLHVEMEMMPVPEGAMEALPGTESVRRGTKENQFDVGGLCRQNQHGSMSGYYW